MTHDPVLEALADVCSAWPALLPPNRVSVSQGAAETLVIRRPGGGGGPWSAQETPYMVEPLDMLASRTHSAVVFVGPAQCGKTVALGEGWMAHAVVNDPGDMLIVQMTQDKAREYSKQRIDRAIRHSPRLHALRSISQRDDNLHDKQFRNGMWLRLAWPTVTNLSSSSYRYAFGTDFDRWPDDIDGEGDGFGLLGKRTTTFQSRGMTCIESSPGRPIRDPSWVPSSPHEAPPVGGILGVYNVSDRRRWYWPCPHCGEWIQAEPGIRLFRLPAFEELVEIIRTVDIDRMAREHAHVACPHCGAIIDAAQRDALNRRGRWVPEGVALDAQGRATGQARGSPIAGYWLGGAAAAYVPWETLVRKYLQAVLDYALTGNELMLQTTTNTDQGAPYASRLVADAATDAATSKRFDADLERYVVPDEGRFLVAAVDVQGGRNARFVVQVHAVGVHKEQWLVDRYAITESRREGTADDWAPIDPASYPDDWDILTERVVAATYRTSAPEREMRVRLVLVDTGGEAGVTDRAYAWYRRLRKADPDLARRVRLTKGANTRSEWHIRTTMVGGEQGLGDIPLQLLEPNKFKDMVAHGLKRKQPGPGYYHFPQPKGPQNPKGWLPQAFFDELAAEVRQENGTWAQVKARNESFDLCYMILAGCMILGVDQRGFWDAPKPWARVHPENTDVISSEERRAVRDAARAAPPTERPRRVSRSGYLA